ncbi:undecaprenyl diphosphate synthase family protein [Halorubrum vacuolatum]|uniref:Undecaprenyl diphosphate synthase n=1 Tax=Halorubrum vacuolatum TaxID=63740 RepID=A0A238WG24_HALVU|nr:undecaprenyl diphosphate synthase family protein [Halorubrum vacuolatum]SNR45525.1 undecaprenyl diphosphate synthase [Halorubrum vacuolatum]
MGPYDASLVLRHRLHDGEPPAHVALVITERDLLTDGAYDTLSDVLSWTFRYGAERLTVSVSVLDESVIDTLVGEFRSLDAPRRMVIRTPADAGSDDDSADSARTDAPIRVNVGLGGKAEFAAAVRDLASDVAAGRLEPEDIDEDHVADRLVFPEEPDLVIKTGAERLSDFAIWQSVYAELYFTDVNWRDFRRRDYLRAVLDFQDRQRRFGR